MAIHHMSWRGHWKWGVGGNKDTRRCLEEAVGEDWSGYCRGRAGEGLEEDGSDEVVLMG